MDNTEFREGSVVTHNSREIGKEFIKSLLERDANKEDSLQHYGVLGMKWGIRRTKARLDRATKRVDKLKAKKKEHDKLTRAKNKLAKMKAEEKELKSKLKGKSTKSDKVKDKTKDKKVEVVSKKKKIRDMSDEELTKMIDRMNLEKRYRELAAPTAETKQKLFDGRSFVSNVSQRSAEDLGTQAAKHFGAKLLNKMIGEEAIYANNKKK